MDENEEYVLRSKREDEERERRLKELEDAAARRHAWRWVRRGVSVGIFLLTGVILPGDGGGDGGCDCG